jgi:cellobiose-specific phosphotransferase system component IIA
MIDMAEVVVKVPEGLTKAIGGELEKPETKILLREAVEEKLRVLLLFKVVDDILKKSKLTDEKFKEIVEEYKGRIAKRHGL